MKRILSCAFISLLLFSCSSQNSDKKLLESKQAWSTQGDVTLSQSELMLSGQEAVATNNSEYKNFELTMECKTSSGSIAGIWLHSKDLTEDIPRSGYEILVNNNIENGDWRKSGSLSAVRNFGKRTAQNDEWFPIKIRVTGKQIKVYINNIWVVDYTEPEKPYRTDLYKNRLFDKGKFVFVNYNGHTEFRNLSVDRLPDDTQSDNPNVDIDEQIDDIIRLQQENYPLIDSHLHLKSWTKAQAATSSRKFGITYGIAPNCGLKFPVTSDKDIYAYLDSMHHTPFLQPMQAEGREWLDLFSEEAMSQFDYRFTDALTWTDNKGRRQRIWIPEETYIDNEEQFMDMLVDRAVTIISTEPFNIFVNPTFLPEKLMPRYEQLWTEARMRRIIDACIEHGIALEINNRYTIPSARLIKQAKAAGVKFTFGTNNASGQDVGKMEYAIQMIKECGITPHDLYIPLSKNL